jgi:siroheme synthase (precorrin-2 oxidase/ferrochelatase)
MDDTLKFFDCTHLPTDLQQVARPYRALAQAIEATLPRNHERQKALDKLLESKDAAVRSKIQQLSQESKSDAV